MVSEPNIAKAGVARLFVRFHDPLMDGDRRPETLPFGPFTEIAVEAGVVFGVSPEPGRTHVLAKPELVGDALKWRVGERVWTDFIVFAEG